MDTVSSFDPTLSVIIALQNARDTVFACVDSLLEQDGLVAGALEIILVDGSQDGTADIVIRRYPGLTLLRWTGSSSLPQLMGTGMAQARGRLVALTEGHCTFAPNWATTAIAAHSVTNGPVVGGAVEPGEELRGLDLALYFCDYGQFLLPIEAGVTHDLPGNNVVFKSEILGQVSDFTRSGFWKTFFCQALEARGDALIAEPRLVACYHRRISLGQLIRRRFLHGRCFGAMRAAQSRPARRLLYALAGPLLPWLLAYRLVRRMWPKTRYRRRFMITLPLCVLVLMLWALGEWAGNLFGAGGSCELL